MLEADNEEKLVMKKAIKLKENLTENVKVFILISIRIIWNIWAIQIDFCLPKLCFSPLIWTRI